MKSYRAAYSRTRPYLTTLMRHQELLTQLRHDLHCHPELSGREEKTAAHIKAFFRKHCPADEVISKIGGYGLTFRYSYPQPGPTVMIRCELDALPIEEPNDFRYQSINEGVSHKCGHDGHMTILAALALRLRETPPARGSVILFFQSAEETGQGAAAALQDARFTALAPDYVFALHNIPGAPLHEVLLTPTTFSPAVQSFSVQLSGKEAHAAEPQNGRNPAVAISRIVAALAPLNVPDPNREDFCVLTPVHLTLGQKAYGISPGEGELHYTIRCWTNTGLDRLKARICQEISRISTAENLRRTINWFEYFPATVNTSRARAIVQSAAMESGKNVTERAHGFTFGEDFGWLAGRYPSVMFGLGAGEDCPALHHAEYDFPDALIATGTSVFSEIIRRILKKN
ncbi:amidohydrolase [Neolewinella agarilytica]|uniref:Amidohydrolase n=2 Tax=Neolewinella agarilytica TaxID=478744 RepID=A0A1H9ADV1_9BACT|nr:amidohydrolase [Neolewinella agarilytica]